MKNKILFFALLLPILLIVYFVGSNNRTENKTFEYVVDESDILNELKIPELINDGDKNISEDEKRGLILMREEEKLARDIYYYLGERWGLKIFTNIAESEQTHTDAMKRLLDYYDLEDPVQENAPGVFASQEMNELYKELTIKGESSLVDALIVGATVEDLDIKDLEDLLSETKRQDIVVVYKNLQKGSRNHLRAFVKNIELRGSSYTPKYISKEMYDSIISSDHERGVILE